MAKKMLSFIEKIKKQTKTDSLDSIDEFSEVKNWVSSGVPDVDWLMNTPGFNPGVLEVAGMSRSGKTTFMLHAIKEVRRQQGVPLIISTERRLSVENVKRMNIPPEEILIRKCKTIEKVFDEASLFINQVRDIDSQIPIFVGVDSLGGTPTKAELNPKKEDQEYMAVAARVIKGRLRRIVQLIDDKNIIFYVNNQTYKAIGQSFGKKTKSYGGEGLKFFRQLGLEISKIKTLKVKDKKVGQVSRFELTKSDFTFPETYVDVELLWGYGYIPSKEILQLAVEDGVMDNYGKHGFLHRTYKALRWKSDSEYYDLMTDVKVRDLLNKICTKVVHKEIKRQRG